MAKKSLAYNCKNETFCKCFPDLVELNQKQEEEAAKNPDHESSRKGINAIDQIMGLKRQTLIIAASVLLVSLIIIIVLYR